MPRTRRNRRRTRRGGRKGGRRSGLHNQNMVTTIPVRFLYTTTFSTSAQTTIITEFNLTAANMGDRATDMADIFLYFRGTAVNLRQVVECGASSSTVVSPPGAYLHAVSFVPISDVDTTTPTGLNMLEYPNFQLTNGTLPCSTRVRGSGMRTLTPWLTTSTTPDGILQAIGTLTVTTISGPIADATNAALTRGYAEVMLKFRTPAATQVTPRLKLRLMECLPTRVTSYYRGLKTVLLDRTKECAKDFFLRQQQFIGETCLRLNVDPKPAPSDDDKKVIVDDEKKVKKTINAWFGSSL